MALVEKAGQELEWLKNHLPARERDITNVGGVLIDGLRSSLQSVKTWREEWAQVLKQMERIGAIVEDKIPKSTTSTAQPKHLPSSHAQPLAARRSHDAVIRVYDESGNVIKTHKHKGDFKEP